MSTQQKQMKKLPEVIADVALALVMDIEDQGYVRGDWPDFSKLNQPNFHCHLKKGRPTYVDCWRVIDKRKN